MTTKEKSEIALRLVHEYIVDSSVCTAEFLASESVPQGLSFEDAFEIYIMVMQACEGDTFYTVKDGETITL